MCDCYFVINPHVLCVSALPIQGWHWCTEIRLFEVWSLEHCTNLWWWRIKATDCIIKFAITKGNTMWRSFALRVCTSKIKKCVPTSASLYEGPIFYFHVFTFMQRVKVFSLFLFIFSFGKHHAMGKDPSIYGHSNIFHLELSLLTVIYMIGKLEGETLSPIFLCIRRMLFVLKICFEC